MAPFRAADLRFLALIAFTAVAVLAFAILYSLGTLIMKRLSLVAALAVAAVVASGCASVPGGSGAGLDFATALQEIAKDPRCGHVDRIQGNLGGLGGNNLAVFLERTCPPAETPKPTP